MYIAKEDIGGYKKGEEVPEAKAIVWKGMYDNSPVEEVGEDSEVEGPKDSEDVDPMIDDYLARGKNVVNKNVREDDLSKEKLESLLKFEESHKKREDVIQTIKKKLGDLN